jgi:Ca2+-transporting ATPase
MGRQIYDNLKKAVFFILAIHVPIAGLAILPVLFQLPLLLLPAHIVFLELVIDPACSLVYEAEAEEADVMKRGPRAANAALADMNSFMHATLQGGIILVLTFALFVVLLRAGSTEGQARATTFLALILSNLALILVNRSQSKGLLATLMRKNRGFTWVSVGALVLITTVLTVPFVRPLFGFDMIRPHELALALGVGLLSLVLTNTCKDTQ